MEKILNIETIDQYDKLFGLETLHPLVNIVDFSKSNKIVEATINLGFYCLFLKNTRCGDLRYGRTLYDYTDGTIVCMAPNQVAGISQHPENIKPNAIGLLFHPSFIRGTSLGQIIKKYSFFSYQSTEALHLSEREREIIVNCLNNITAELQHGIDKHTRGLVTANIELLLEYCLRFYDRQFVTREQTNSDILARFESLIDQYFQDKLQVSQGLPTVKYFADKICLSSNYFGDLIKKETGKSAQEFIQSRVLDLGKELILGSDKTIAEISYQLGFQYTQHFSRFFKRHVGITPTEFRHVN